MKTKRTIAASLPIRTDQLNKDGNWTIAAPMESTVKPFHGIADKKKCKVFIRENIRNIPYWINNRDFDGHDPDYTYKNYSFLEKRRRFREEFDLDFLLDQ